MRTLYTDELRFTAYAFYYPKGEWEFYVNYSLFIDKNGHFGLMKHDTLENKNLFYQGMLDDTLLRMVNQELLADTFNTDYRKEQLYNIAYSGLTYCLDLKKDSIHKRILFIQKNSPSRLNKLSDLFINLTNQVDSKKVDAIDFSTYLNGLKNLCLSSMGPPPKIVTSEKWIPDKIPE